MKNNHALKVFCAVALAPVAVMADPGSPERAAASFGNVLSLDPRLTYEQGDFEAHAGRYAALIHERVVSIGGLPALGATPLQVNCPSGGTMRLTAQSTATLMIVLNDCATEESEVRHVAGGEMRLGYLLYSEIAPRYSLVQFGSRHQDFIETVQFNPPREPSTPPQRYTLNFTMTGALPQWEGNGPPLTGIFQYLVQGRFSALEYSLYGDQAIASTYNVNADSISIRGSIRRGTDENPIAVNRREYQSGELEYSARDGFTDARVSHRYRFDRFRLGRFENLSTGALERSYDGEIRLFDNQYACANGRFEFETLRPLLQPIQDGTFNFAAGGIRVLGDATIRFSEADSSVLLKVYGFSPMGFPSGQDLVAFGGCSY